MPARSKHVTLSHSNKPTKVREALTSDVIQEIISKIGDLPDDHRRLMALFLFTGMRRGEVLGLRWEDIDLEKKSIEVKRNTTYADNQAEVTSPKTTNGYRRPWKLLVHHDPLCAQQRTGCAERRREV